MLRLIPLIFLALSPVASAAEKPVSDTPGIKIEKFAGSDFIKHPTGIAFTKDGKLLAIESHTHFRPEGYEGPADDQVVWLRDTDGDGMVDERSVFYGENLQATMDIAVHPETGAVYLSTRNEVLRLWDKDGDGVADADSVERRLVFLDTEADYPHNGVSGLCFGDDGGLYFGIGENFGADYTLTGSDGSSVSDGGEGGNIWHVDRNGGDLRRVATGFWNPFGVCHAPGGHVFATDNDPSSRPPSRLHYIVEGGDYGYQYRYGRSGQHPFISWDGELTGTLPMLHGSGEAPCDVVFHKGNLLVASWADHRIEMYPLEWKETHFDTEQEILIRGGNEFRPVAFAFAPDGALYCSDWVKSDYALHGEGAIWKITGWNPEEKEMPQSPLWLRGLKVETFTIEDADDAWLVPAIIRQFDANWDDLSSPTEKKIWLLSHRNKNPEIDAAGAISKALSDPDPELRLLALKWISDERLEPYRAAAEAIATDPPSAILFHAAVTALARLDGQDVDDKAIQTRIGEMLQSEKVIPAVRGAAFRVLSDRERFLKISDLKQIYQGGDIDLKIDVLITLLTHPDQEAAKGWASQIAKSEETPERIVPFAMEVAEKLQPTISGTERPPLDDTAAWLKLLDNEPRGERNDAEIADHGRLVFHRHCAVCHSAEGFGRQGGPDLTAIDERDREYILESILQPGAEIAPQYEAWENKMADGSTLTGFMLGQRGGTHFYTDIAGQSFEINNREIAERRRVPVSLMPPGLPLQMSDRDLTDLLAWLSR